MGLLELQGLSRFLGNCTQLQETAQKFRGLPLRNIHIAQKLRKTLRDLFSQLNLLAPSVFIGPKLQGPVQKSGGCSELWRTAQKSGVLPRTSKDCHEVRMTAQNFRGLLRTPRDYPGDCPELQRSAQNSSGLPRTPRVCPEVRGTSQKSGKLPRSFEDCPDVFETSKNFQTKFSYSLEMFIILIPMAFQKL